MLRYQYSKTDHRLTTEKAGHRGTLIIFKWN